MGRRADGVAEQRWRGRLRRFGRSGLTVLEFCERESVSTSSFYAWRRRLASDAMPGRQPARSAERPLFVPVSVRSAARGVRIELPGGAVVELPRDADERLVQSCLRAVADLGRASEQERC